MATSLVTLSSEKWTNVGEGPVMIQKKHSMSVIYLHANTPDANVAIEEEAYHYFNPVNETISYGGSDCIYLRTNKGTTTVIVTQIS